MPQFILNAARTDFANVFTAVQTMPINGLVVGTNQLVASGGFIGVGTATPACLITASSNGSTDPRGIMSAQYSTDVNGARFQLRKARGTEASPVVIVTGDSLGKVRFSGYDGSNYLQMGSIDVIATGTIASTRVPTYMALAVATDAAPSVLTEWVRAQPNGFVGFGTGTAVPAGNVEVKSASSNVYSVVSRSTQSQGEVGVILKGGTSGADWYIYQGSSLDTLKMYNSKSGTQGDKMILGNDGSLTITNTLNLTSSGLLSVGFSSPASAFALEVFKASGPQFVMSQNSSISTKRLGYDIESTAVDNTDATRKYRATHYVYDTTSREFMRGEASGTAAMIGFLGAAASARITAGAATAGGTYGATEQTMLQKAYDALRTFGLIT